MKFTSVRLRLTLWNIGVLACVLFGFLLATHLAVRSYLLASMDNRLAGMAERQQHFISRVHDDPPPTFRSRNSRFDRQDGNRITRISRTYTLDGKQYRLPNFPAPPYAPPWDHEAFEQAAAGKAVFSMAVEDDTPVRVHSRPLRINDKQVGVVQVAVSFAEMEDLLESLTRLLLLLVPCALVIAAAGGLFLTNSALRPVRQLVHAAEELNPDALSQRLPVVGADEFAHLATTMNGMLARVEGAFTRLTDSFERERRFTSDASHELRTPLTAIKANASLALRGDRSAVQYREALQAIHQAADTMHRLVQDLLMIARSDSGQFGLQSQAIAPDRLVHDAVALHKHDELSATVRITVAPDISPIWGDPHHLQRLLTNLLDNALRHTPPTGEVVVSAHEAGEGVVLTVADTGEGIAPEHLEHLGERFYRIDAARARQHGGTGLGLAISKSIVEAHGGTLVIDSTLGAGTQVTVTLPKVTADQCPSG
jgi:heavy metal sensor kinase